MRICMITAYPPNRGGLAEYGWYMAEELSKNIEVEDLIVLANRSKVPYRVDKNKIKVVQCWKSDDITTPLRILKEIKRIQPDIVYFNLHLLSWGKSKIINFFCHAAPFLIKIFSRCKVVITLHNIGEAVDLRHIDFIPASKISQLGIFLATRLILQADMIVVTLKSYTHILKRKYVKANIVYIPLGTPEFNVKRKKSGNNKLLTFGYWSKSKNLPLLLEAFKELSKRYPTLKLVVVGDSNSKTPDYLEGIRRLYTGRNIKFSGYAPENELKSAILSADIVILPYLTATGSSSALHWSIACGKPVIASDIPMFREMSIEEGIAIRFFKSDNKQSLIRAIENLLTNRALRSKMGKKNLMAAKSMSFRRVANDYVRLFDKILRQR